MTLDRTAARARCVRASNEAYTRRCLTGNISMVIEEDLPAALDALDAKDAEIERLRGALKRTTNLVGVLTIRQIIEAGDEVIEAAGLNPWCINEGLATGDEHLSLWWAEQALGGES